MVPNACSVTQFRNCLSVVVCLLSILGFAITAHAQSATYHLHKEASTTANLFQLKTAGPDGTSLALQTANLKNAATGEYLIKAFDTQSGVPNASGLIPAGSTVTFNVWMKKTASQGTMFPRVKLSLNSAAGTSLCVITGTTALTTTLTKYTLTATTASNLTLTTSDRFYVWAGTNLTASSNQNNFAELDVEGTLNGNFDSLVTVPLPVAGPSIGNLSPNAAGIGTPITVTGTGFGATQGTSTITFNGIAATPTSWSATSIAVPVPSGTTTGPVIINVGGQTSNGVNFTVTPKINSLTPSSGPIGTPVTISGTSFGSTQGTSTITFNGTAATPNSWSATSILVGVPAGSTTGPVIVTVAGQSSNAVTFTITTTGTLSGAITRTSDGAPINGAVVEAVQSGVVKGSTATAANGSYSIGSVGVGTYDVRASAAGYQTRTQNGVVVTTNTTTTVNQSLDLATTGDINYVYDEAGRLIGVITPTETVTYTYDAVGNLLSISRGNASQVSIIEFTPNNGPIGTEVTIFGTAFSSTPAQNTITFNGVAATVTSASATQIVTNVPVGATTGPISVTSPSGTATTSTSFVVGTPGAPTVTGFNPTIGTPGTSVTITGTNFEANLFNNRVEFNLTLAGVTSATTTNIVTSVPSSASSGRITVRTPGGTGVSSSDFFVPPAPYTATNVEVTGRMSIGESKTVNITQANKIGIILFDGVAGQRVTLGMAGVTFGAPNCCDTASIVIYKPNGVLVPAFGFGTGGNGTASQVLPVTGTYSIVVDPYDANTGSVTLNLFEDVAVPISINGPAVTLDLSQVGQNGRLSFNGTAGQRISVGLSGITISPGYCCDVGAVSIYTPEEGVLLAPFAFSTGGAGTPSQVLPVSGTYTIIIDPYVGRTGSVTVTLSEDLAPPSNLNGPAVNLDFRVGQNARLTFDGTAGQRISVGLSGITIGQGYCCDVGSIAMYKPDGTVLLAPFAFSNGGAGTPTQVLPVTGTYSIVVDPYIGRSGSVTFTLSEDLSPPTSINGTPATMDFRAGQNAWLSFEGVAGQQVSVGVSGITIGTGYCCDVGSIALYKPDGTVLLAPFAFSTAGAGTPSQVLPVTGTYFVAIDPYIGRSGSLTANVSGDLTGPITIDGPAVTLDFNTGQNAKLTFEGIAGQRVSVGLTGITVGTGYCCDVGSVALYKPDGSVLLSPFAFSTAGAGTPSQVLPVTGTYSIVIDPYIGRTGSITVTLSKDLSPPITVNGPALALDFRAGQNTWLLFDGTAGQRVSVGVSGITIGTGFCCDVGSVALYKPDGTVLLAPYAFSTGGAGTPSQVLPVTGTYAVLIDPYIGRSGAATVTLSEDLAPPITINGASVGLDFKAGQNARLTFDGVAGQRVSVGLTGITIGTGFCCDVGSVALYKPDGTVLLAPYAFSTGGAGTPSQVLPVTGTYSIVIDPYIARTGLATVTLSEDLSPPISATGPPVTMDFRAGQNARLTFDGVAGQRVSLGVNGVTIGTGFCCDVGSVALYKPDETALLSPVGFSTNGVSSATQVLPTTGTYSIVVDPYIGRTGSLNLVLSEDLTGSIVIDGSPVTLQFDRVGQNARLSFSGTAGQWVSVGMTDATVGSVSCCATSTVSILKPDGTTLLAPFGFFSNGGGTPSVQLPATGTYSLVVDPYNSNLGTVTLTLSEDLSPPITINGPAPTLTNRPGQNARLLFSGNAGQWVSVGITDATIGATSCCTTSTVSILKPDGTTLLSPFQFYSGGGGTPSVQLPTTGTYAIFVDAYNAVTGTATITLSEDLSPPITINGPSPTLTVRPGQNGRLLFSGTAGQWVSVGITDATIGATSCCTTSTVSILKPDGTTLLSPFQFYSGGGGTPSVQLPTTGTYAIFVDAYNAVTGTATVTLSEDLSPAISINGAAQILTLRPGQNGRLLFSGTAGQRVSGGMSDTTIGATSCCTTSTVSILKPDGTNLLSPFQFYSGGAGTPTVVLPVSGTYAIFVDAYNAVAGNVTVTLSEDLAPPISINGPPLIITNRAGQNAQLLFTGTTGQWISLGVTDTTIAAPSCCTTSTVTIFKPDGTTLLGSTGFYQPGLATSSMQLPASGTYSLVLDPYNAVAGDTSLTLSEDLATTISVNASATPLTFRAGQNGTISFNGTSGQQITVHITNNNLGSVIVRLLRPDGSQMTATTSGSVSFNLATQTLTSSGTYKISIDPNGVIGGGISVNVTNP